MQQYSWPTNALLRDFNPKTPNVRWSLFVLVQQRSAVAASKQQNGGMCIHPHVDSTNLYIFTPRYSESIRKYQRSRGYKSKRDTLCRTNDGPEEDNERHLGGGRAAVALGFCGCQARTVSHSKKNEVALSFLPQTWWLVVATDVGRAVLACLRLAERTAAWCWRACVWWRRRRGHERVRDHLRGIAAAGHSWW